MKLNKNFLVHKTANETIIVPSGKAKFSGVVRGNVTLGVILDLLQKGMTTEEIISNMKERYDASDEVIRNDVVTTVSQLREIGAIDD